MHADLAAVAAHQLGVFTSKQAQRAGYSIDEIKTELGTRRWTRLRRGVYAGTSVVRAADAVHRHLLDCIAVLLCLDPGPVLSHASAARLHGLVVPSSVSNEVRVTDTDWQRGKGYRIARAFVPPEDVVPWLGFEATSVARTLVDCAREWSLRRAVVAMDSALSTGKLTRADLHAAVLAATHRVGISTAGRAYGLCDGRAESPLESLGRMALRSAGLPTPELQVELWDGDVFLARVDAWYDEAAVALEFDGWVKYAEPFSGTAEDALRREKRREDAVRARDVRVVRIVNDDLRAGWPRMADNIRQLLSTRPIGPRRFHVVRTPEPGGLADAA